MTALFTLAGLYVSAHDLLARLLADIQSSVVLVSVIWVIVLSRLEQKDVTCKHTLWFFHFSLD